MAAEERVVFVGVVRVTDGALLASVFSDSKLAAQEKQQLERQFLQTCQQQRGSVNPEFKSKVRLEYPCSGNLFVKSGSEMSKHCLFACGVKDESYPDRLAYSCLQEVVERVHMTQGDSLHHLGSLSLTKPLKKPLREIMKKFQDADRNKTLEVQEKVDELKDTMQDNVRRILETHHTLDNLEQRTDNMSQQANQFLKQSVDLRRAIQWRNLKLKLLSGLIGLSVITYFVLIVAAA